MQKLITSWGSFPKVFSHYFAPTVNELSSIARLNHWIPRGLGRSYGDSAVAETVATTERLKYFLAFDELTGILHCQSGVSLAEIIEAFLPRGWFLPVTPGTKFVTVGGAIASDVHGKNHHHVGCFSEFVEELELLTPEGERLICSHKKNLEVFYATCGGMGLTGLILSAKIHLQKVVSSWICQQTIRTRDLTETIEVLQANKQVTYSVAWLDCLAPKNALGRSLVLLGEHAHDAAYSLDLPRKHWPLLDKTAFASVQENNYLMKAFSPFLNPLSIQVFNQLYYYLPRQAESFIFFDKYFYPLDSLRNWNQLYGKAGFTQYQFVIPLDQANIMHKILAAIRDYGAASFLSVLKIFGAENKNYLSFPMEGLTLALDFKITSKLWSFLDQLDSLVMQAGGRLYLTKDCRLNAENFRTMYPHIEDFLVVREKLDPRRKLQSLQSKRLEI
jgi:FAD/FMN-containing dehydrogenase